MFIIGGLGYIVPSILFWIFGSAEVQEWNKIQTQDSYNDHHTNNSIDNTVSDEKSA